MARRIKENKMKYTAKQQRDIDYLVKIGANTRLEEYKARLEKRAAEKKAYREKAKKEAAEAAKLVKVGDVFSCSWGYDQTNVDFFQVVALVGKGSVRVRQVQPALIAENPGMMCADRTYEIPGDGTLLPTTGHSVFIKDNVNGDVKRIQPGYGTEPRPTIKLSSFAWGHLEKPGQTKHYESWYA